MNSQNIELTLRVNGKPVAEYTKDGRVFIEGKAGSSYSLYIRNNNGFKVMVVPSIDGVSVLTGKPATGTPTESGYILGAYETLTVDGYRLSNEAVAAFKFVEAGKSYAQKEKGMEGTTGVIGLRVWKEKPTPPPAVTKIENHYWTWWNQPVYRRSDFVTWTESAGATGGISYGCGPMSYGGSETKAMNCSFNTAVAQSSVEQDTSPFTLGSTFGGQLDSKVKEVAFEVGELHAELTFYYATRADLVNKLGIDISRAKKVAFPQAFGQYCQPPADWKGE